MKPKFISALCTQLTTTDALHRDGMAVQIDQQWAAGIHGVLALGTMGLMQLQSDEVYRGVVEMTVERSRGKGEVMVGAGDASFPRTRDRILFLNTQQIDGVAVLAPYLINFDQEQLIEYYRAIADVSKAPLYLYDLPQLTRSKLQLETVLELSKHPNIHGIKCSDEPAYTRALVDRVGDSFRVIIAQPDLVDVFLRFGIGDHLDGMFAIAPEWTVAIGKSAVAGDWDAAARYQRDLSPLRRLLMKYGLLSAVTVMMNARGVQGKSAPAPYKILPDAQRDALLNEPALRKLIEFVKRD